uniref:Secreted protein n=1 Tax=Panstrongylus lignarius TaxID=156445 RepID=A0A224XLX5_9HEMI
MWLMKYVFIILVISCTISPGVTIRELDKAILDYYCRKEKEEVSHYHPFYCFIWIFATCILLLYTLWIMYSIKEPSMSLMESIQFNNLKKTSYHTIPINFEDDLLETYHRKTDKGLSTNNCFPYLNFLNKFISYAQCNNQLHKQDSGILLSEIKPHYDKKVKRIYAWKEDFSKKRILF